VNGLALLERFVEFDLLWQNMARSPAASWQEIGAPSRSTRGGHPD